MDALKTESIMFLRSSRGGKTFSKTSALSQTTKKKGFSNKQISTFAAERIINKFNP